MPAGALLALLLLAPLRLLAQPAMPAAGGDYPGFDVRYGIAPGADLPALVGKVALISMTAEKFLDPATGERRLVGYGESQGVFDLSLAEIRAVLDDPAGATSYSPRLLEARLEEADGPRLVFYQDIGISFLGIRLSYRFRAEQVRDDLGPAEVGYRVRLLESLDGHFFEAYSSWYLKEVSVEGRSLVYVRYYTRPGLRRPPLGTELVVRSFTPGELRATMERVAKEARRRASLSLDSDMPPR